MRFRPRFDAICRRCYDFAPGAVVATIISPGGALGPEIVTVTTIYRKGTPFIYYVVTVV